jgi:DNA-binding MarR family transcriptional regulator
MEKDKIREFRKALRRFDRLNELLNSSCCSGVTMAQCHVLLEIEENSEITTNQLADNLKLDKSTLSRTIDKLVNAGLVDRKINSNDRRYTFLFLTKAGQTKCKEINDVNDTTYNQIFNTISTEKPEEIVTHFKFLVEAMNNYIRNTSNKNNCCQQD